MGGEADLGRRLSQLQLLIIPLAALQVEPMDIEALLRRSSVDGGVRLQHDMVVFHHVDWNLVLPGVVL